MDQLVVSEDKTTPTKSIQDRCGVIKTDTDHETISTVVEKIIRLTRNVYLLSCTRSWIRMGTSGRKRSWNIPRTLCTTQSSSSPPRTDSTLQRCMSSSTKDLWLLTGKTMSSSFRIRLTCKRHYSPRVVVTASPIVTMVQMMFRRKPWTRKSVLRLQR